MPKPNVTRVQSATEWTASVHTLHMSKPNVTRVQSATEWTASVHTLHMSKPNVTRVQSATEWTASVHTPHMPKPNVTRVQSATEWTASVHTPHMPKPNLTRVQSATEWTASVHSARCWPAMCKARVIRNFHVKHNKFEFAKKLPDVKRPKRGVVAGTACGLLWTNSFRLNFETNQEKEARWMIKFSLTSMLGSGATTCQKTQTSKWNWPKFADQVRCRPCQKKRPPIAHVQTP